MIRFHKPLKQATFIQRKSANMVEADIGAMKIDILCPSHSLLANCAILGSKIWYTPAELLPYYVPPIWQLSEVDYGNLVLVNNNLCVDLFKDGFRNNTIKINGLNPTKNQIVFNQEQSLPGGYYYDFNLQSDQKNCYIIVTGSSYNNDLITKNCNYFPELNYLDATPEIYNLIHARMLGHRAILCCFILNHGVNKLCLTDRYNPHYARLLFKAIELGVEFMVYGVVINSNSIQVVDSIVVK
jgi:DNA-binding sugar fermentation-stimulating protein